MLPFFLSFFGCNTLGAWRVLSGAIGLPSRSTESQAEEPGAEAAAAPPETDIGSSLPQSRELQELQVAGSGLSKFETWGQPCNMLYNRQLCPVVAGEMSEPQSRVACLDQAPARRSISETLRAASAEDQGGAWDTLRMMVTHWTKKRPAKLDKMKGLMSLIYTALQPSGGLNKEVNKHDQERFSGSYEN